MEPDRTAKELFQRLQVEHPGRFPDGQLRTLQRRVKEWRRAEAHRLIFPTADISNGGEDGHSPIFGDSSADGPAPKTAPPPDTAVAE